MTKSILSTLSTKLVVLAVFFSIILSPLSAQAQTPDVATQLNALVAALATIGDSIAASPNLTEDERYALMIQLVAISNQIMNLQNNNVGWVDPMEAEAAKDSAEEAGLTRVRVAFNPTTNEVVTDVTIRSNTTRTTEVLSELSQHPFFASKIERLREIIAMRVSNAENIKFLDVNDALFVTARDPERANPVAVNSNVAVYLADNFSRNSILTKIQVLPGNNTGAIRIYSDQEDYVQLTLEREGDSEGNISNSNTFRYTREYFIDDAINPGETYNPSLEGMDPQPRAFDSEGNIREDEVFGFLTALLNVLPFTSRIPDYGEKLTRFLVGNSIRYDGDLNTPDERRDCYSSGDKVIVNEFIEFVVDGLQAQYDDVEEITEYLAPLGGDGNSGCSSRTRFF